MGNRAARGGSILRMLEITRERQKKVPVVLRWLAEWNSMRRSTTAVVATGTNASRISCACVNADAFRHARQEPHAPQPPL